MTRYLLDTNHVSEGIQKVSHIRDRLQQSNREGNKFGTCAPVLCELEVGVQQLVDPTAARRRLDAVLEIVRLWSIDVDVARIYGTLYRELKRRGRALSQVDLMLGSLAVHMNLTLLTTDRDFEALPEVQRENWLST
jgi:predicted nucleic acid-binding protein